MKTSTVLSLIISFLILSESESLGPRPGIFWDAFHQANIERITSLHIPQRVKIPQKTKNQMNDLVENLKCFMKGPNILKCIDASVIFYLPNKPQKSWAPFGFNPKGSNNHLLQS